MTKLEDLLEALTLEKRHLKLKKMTKTRRRRRRRRGMEILTTAKATIAKISLGNSLSLFWHWSFYVLDAWRVPFWQTHQSPLKSHNHIYRHPQWHLKK
jgi:hypothetical protein